MHHSPQHESPIGAVPETTDKKYKEHIHIGSDFSFSVTPQRYIYIFGKKAGQCHVPSFPKFSNGTGFIGRIKVLRQVDIHHFSKPHCHITITAEVKINLNGIGQYQKNCLCGIQAAYHRVTISNQIAESICNQHLFGKTQCKNIDTACQMIEINFFLFFIQKLGNQLIMGNNRSCYQLRKICYETRIMQEIVPRYFTPVRIHNKRYLLKCEKTDSKRHHYS